MDFSGLYSLFPEMILFALLLIGVYSNKNKPKKRTSESICTPPGINSYVLHNKFCFLENVTTKI